MQTDQTDQTDQTFTYIKDIFDIQHKLNSSILGGEYTSSNIPFHRATVVETAELYDHVGYKWWKHQEEGSIEQAQLEIVDILHFFVSELLCQHPEDYHQMCIPLLITDFTNNRITKTASKESKLLAVDKFINANPQYLADRTNAFVQLCYEFDLSLLKLYKMYIGKNALNYFRQANGYKDGSYNKNNWKNKNNEPCEDNVVLAEILETEWNTFEDVYNNLQTHYSAL